MGERPLRAVDHADRRAAASIAAARRCDLLGRRTRTRPDAATAPTAAQGAPKSAARARPRPITYVLIDCPPSLNLLTFNAHGRGRRGAGAAAMRVLRPRGPVAAAEARSSRCAAASIPALEIQGVVLTMFDRRNSLADQVAADVRAHFGDKVYDTVIPRNVRVSEAPSHGKPALLYDLRCAGSQAYLKLASRSHSTRRALAAR